MITAPDLDALRRLPRSKGVPATFGQRLETAWELGKLADNVLSRQLNMERIARAAQAEAERRTGVPMKGSLPDGKLPNQHEAYLTELESEAIRIAQMRPDIDLSDLPLTREQVFNAWKSEAQEKQSESELQAAADPGFSGGQALGSISALVTDPVLLPTLVAGAGVGTTILRGMAIESGIALAVESAAQIPIQSNRKDLGLPYGFGQALANISGAGLGAGAIYGLTRIGSSAFRKLLDSIDLQRATPDQKAAFAAIDDLQRSVETAVVREPSTREIAAHQRNLDQALLDLQAGRAANIAGVDAGDLPLGFMRAGEVREALLPTMRAIGLELDELVPGLVNAMRMQSDFVDIAFTRSIVEDVNSRIARLAGQERELNEAYLRSTTALSEAFEARAAIDARLQAAERLLRRTKGARRQTEQTPAWARIADKDDVERQALSILDSKAWERKIAERGVDTPEVRRAVKRKLEDMRQSRDAADRRVSKAKVRAGADEEALAAYHRRAAKAGARLRDRIVSRFSDAELARMARSAREVVGPAERQVAERSQQEDAAAEALAADPVATQAAVIQARADIESMSGRIDAEYDKALRDEMDAIEEMDALELEARACMRGVADA